MPDPSSTAGGAAACAWSAALAGLSALAVAIGIGRFAFTPLLPMMQADAGLSISQGAWLAAANYAGYFIGALSAIGLRVRPANAIRAGLALIALTTLAMGLEGGFPAWLGLRAAAGVASAWVLVFVSAWALEQLARLGRPGLGGVVYAGVGAGIVIAGLACLAIMASQAGSRDAWRTLGGISVAVTLAVWLRIRPEPADGAAPVRASMPPAAWRPGSWRLTLCYGVFGFGYIIPATFLPAMAKAIVADPQLFGWAWPVFGAAAAASTLLATRLEHVLSHRAVWIGGQLVMAAGVVVPLVLPGLAGVLVAAALVGGTFMVVTMAGMQEARRVAGAGARTLMAAMTAAFAFGQILGPAIVGVLARSTDGFAPALALAAALLVASSLVLKGERQ